ncbi:MAG: SDR family NAD(P)-dependent oxidoreductase [Chloroflexi bacterium]|nr:SDR family NAD(P)-dependent oxidoreductase [Chloroflexota bacterium]
MANAKRALVTGGTGALGLSVAQALLGAGWETHVSAATAESAQRFQQTPQGRGLTVHAADLATPDGTRRLFRETGGPLAALVATIGGYSGGPLASMTDAAIDHLIDMNLKTAVLTLREAYPHLKQNPGGAAVVLVAARGAVSGGPGSAVYAATKAAIVNLAQSTAQEWLRDGITVNAILPSTMDTPANRSAMPDADFSLWPTTGQIADVVAFLVSDKARIVSGGAIPVYGKA